MKPWMKIVSGLSLFVFTIAFIIIWDTMIKDRIDSVEVVVVRPGIIIEKNEVITGNKIIVEKRNRATLIEGVVYAKDISKILGYEAKQQLYGNTIFSERYVDFDRLSPDASKGEAIRPIPSNWIYASPSTIRRKDYIDLYIFRPEERLKEKSTISFEGLSPEQQLKLKEHNEQLTLENEKYQEQRVEIANNKNIEVVDTSSVNSDGLSDEVNRVFEEVNAVVKGEKITGTHQERQSERLISALGISNDEWLKLIEYGEIPILVDIPIVYAKDGSGNEIQNGETSTEEKRFTSTGVVTELEVLLNEDEYRLLKKYMEKGYKLYITYN